MSKSVMVDKHIFELICDHFKELDMESASPRDKEIIGWLLSKQISQFHHDSYLEDKARQERIDTYLRT